MTTLPVYTTGFGLRFAQNFARFPKADQLKIAAFQTQFESYGLHNFSNYPGKIAPSWGGLTSAHPNFSYTRNNDLWHYHIGIPVWTPSPVAPYHTSDWLLHFQWPGRGNYIRIVELLPHNSSTGAFNLPDPSALA